MCLRGGSCGGGRAAVSSGLAAAEPTLAPGTGENVCANLDLLTIVPVRGYRTVSLPYKLKRVAGFPSSRSQNWAMWHLPCRFRWPGQPFQLQTGAGDLKQAASC